MVFEEDSLSLSAAAEALATKGKGASIVRSFHVYSLGADLVAKFSLIVVKKALFWQCFSSMFVQIESFLIDWGLILLQATFFTASPTTYFCFVGKYSGNGGGP